MSRTHPRISYALLLSSFFCGGAAFPSCAQDSQPAPPGSSVPGLFAYHRNDSAPDQVTRIHINALHKAPWTIQPNIFGNFLEHLGSAVYGGVWADNLHNPNLEKINDRDTAPQGWWFTGSTTWQPDGYLSPWCVRLAAPDGALLQRTFLPVHRIRSYSGTFYARSRGGTGRITVLLQGADARAGQTFAQTSLTITGERWRRQACHFKLPADRPARGDAEQFAILHSGGEPVDVDQVQLFPDDAVDGLDPDVIRAARAWHIPILRMAGNFSSGYHWQDGVGPQERRPTVRNQAWGGVESNEFGTDEFINFARHIGAPVQIAVNAGNGTPEEAAGWVRYCKEHKQKVAIWEIGNELYGGWQIGHTDAAGNADRFLQFRKAMLEVDPTLQIIATGKGNSFSTDGVEGDWGWNNAVLSAAIAGGARPPDYLSIHPLVPMPGGLQNFSFEEQFQSAMAQPTFVDRALLPTLAEKIKALEGPDAPTRIAPTEWGIIVGGEHWRDSPTHDALSGAIFSALTLNALLRHGDRVTLANMTGLMHGGGIKKPNGIVIVDPQYYTQQLYALAAPRVPVETTWDGPGQDVPQRDYLPAVTDVPDVDVFSALGQDGRQLTIFLVNRRLNQVRLVQLQVANFHARGALATILTAADPQAGNSWEVPNKVAPQTFLLPRSSDGSHWNFSIPAHALVVITLQR